MNTIAKCKFGVCKKYVAYSPTDASVGCRYCDKHKPSNFFN